MMEAQYRNEGSLLAHFVTSIMQRHAELTNYPKEVGNPPLKKMLSIASPYLSEAVWHGELRTLLSMLCSGSWEQKANAAMRLAVYELIASDGQGKPPINVERLASRCGIEKIVQDANIRHLKGVLVQTGDGTYEINLPIKILYYSKRFTIAHEISHVLLRKAAGPSALRLLDEGKFRPLLERICNAGAAELLIPFYVVYPVVEGGVDIGTLTDIGKSCQASLQTTAVQIAEVCERVCGYSCQFMLIEFSDNQDTRLLWQTRSYRLPIWINNKNLFQKVIERVREGKQGNRGYFPFIAPDGQEVKYEFEIRLMQAPHCNFTTALFLLTRLGKLTNGSGLFKYPKGIPTEEST
jgi:hypothetical protein